MRFLAALVLACVAASGASACDAAKAGFAVGEAFTPALAERARAAAGAAKVRRMIPGMAYTMEFDSARLNLRTDDSGRIVSAACG